MIASEERVVMMSATERFDLRNDVGDRDVADDGDDGDDDDDDVGVVSGEGAGVKEFCVTSCKVEMHAKWLAVSSTLFAQVPPSEYNEPVSLLS